MALRIKKGDKVVVIAGAHKGSEGEVLKVIPETDRLIVSGVARVKRHQKPTPHNPEGGIIEKEAPIHRSNVMLLDTKTNKPTRVRVETNEDGKKVRFAKKSGETIDG